MKEYIEREAAIDYIDNEISKRLINELPAADVQEVRHGEWYVIEYEYLNCSVCGESMYTGCNSTKEAELLKHHWKNYCPNCGARMDGKGDDR